MATARTARLNSSPEPGSTPDPKALSTESAYLTAQGRQLLEDRIALLEERMGELQSRLDDPESRADSVEEYQRVTAEIAAMRSLVRRSVAIDEIPDDPQVVKLGDAVAIRHEDGAEECYIIAHKAEASMDDGRISSESPLARALLDQRVGDTVEVRAPSSSYRCTILSASRGTG